MAVSILIRAVERDTGESAEVLLARSVEETRRVAEKKHGRTFRFTSKFPFIGRGNVLRDRIVSHEEVEAMFAEAIRE